MIDACRWHLFQPGEFVTRVDDVADGFFGVASGSVGLTSSLGAPDTPLAHLVQPGEWYGVDPNFLGGRRSSSVVARTSAVIAHLTSAAIDRLAHQDARTWRYIGFLATRGTDVASNIAIDLMIRDSRRRCLATLLRLAGARFHTPPRRPLQAPVNQAELAAIANLSRNSVSTILRRAETAGWIEIHYAMIVINDADALRWIVDEG